MARYITSRILWLIPVLFFVSLVTFTLMHAVEGGPWDQERKLPDSVTAVLDKEYGLDKPVWRQYVDFLYNAVRGDLGVSFMRQNRPVTSILLDGFKTSALLGGISLALVCFVGVTLGVVAAVNRNGPLDYFSVFFASMGSAVPGFILGILLMYVLSVKLHLLPTFGWGTWQQAIMPTLTLAALPTAFLARVTRSSMLEVLSQDYIRTAHAKGLSSFTVLNRHALRNALIPIVTVIGPIAARLVTGSFIVEQMFSIPGIGRLFVQSVNARDYGLIMGTTLFFALVVAAANLAVDIAYAVVDPKIRFAKG